MICGRYMNYLYYLVSLLSFAFLFEALKGEI